MKKREDMTPAALIAALLGGEDSENFLAATTPGGIEQQELDGQIKFLSKEVLPQKANHCSVHAEVAYHRMGIEILDVVDDLFLSVKLPDGWRKIGTEHRLWTRLLDNKGRERATIFYKAAFYDRDAFININQRYSTKTEPLGGYDNYDRDNPPPTVSTVRDQGTIIWQSEPVEIPRGGWMIEKSLREQGEAWLIEHYPNWQDEFAYWE